MYPPSVRLTSKHCFRDKTNSLFYLDPFSNAYYAKRKQKKARKSRGIETLSDIENLDIMLGENHFNGNEKDESLGSNCARMPESTVEDEFENNDENRHLDLGVVDPNTNADYGRNSTEGNSSAEINSEGC